MNKNISIRLFCEDTLGVGEKIYLEKDQTHYLKNVMRCKINDKVIVFDNTTGEYLAEIINIHKKFVNIQILEKTKPRYVPGDVWLIFCPLKKTRTDFLIEKCNELGLIKFLPTLSDKTQTKKISVDRFKKNIVEGKIGFPKIIKPTVGSWGRMVSKLNDMDAAEGIIEGREAMYPIHHIHFLEEFVQRPPRDIRVIVIGDNVAAGIYRNSGDGNWKTNTHLGGSAETCEITKELEDICI